MEKWNKKYILRRLTTFFCFHFRLNAVINLTRALSITSYREILCEFYSDWFGWSSSSWNFFWMLLEIFVGFYFLDERSQLWEIMLSLAMEKKLLQSWGFKEKMNLSQCCYFYSKIQSNKIFKTFSFNFFKFSKVPSRCSHFKTLNKEQSFRLYNL